MKPAITCLAIIKPITIFMYNVLSYNKWFFLCINYPINNKGYQVLTQRQHHLF